MFPLNLWFMLMVRWNFENWSLFNGDAATGRPLNVSQVKTLHGVNNGEKPGKVRKVKDRAADVCGPPCLPTRLSSLSYLHLSVFLLLVLFLLCPCFLCAPLLLFLTPPSLSVCHFFCFHSCLLTALHLFSLTFLPFHRFDADYVPKHKPRSAQLKGALTKPKEDTDSHQTPPLNHSYMKVLVRLQRTNPKKFTKSELKLWSSLKKLQKMLRGIRKTQKQEQRGKVNWGDESN